MLKSESRNVLSIKSPKTAKEGSSNGSIPEKWRINIPGHRNTKLKIPIRPSTKKVFHIVSCFFWVHSLLYRTSYSEYKIVDKITKIYPSTSTFTPFSFLFPNRATITIPPTQIKTLRILIVVIFSFNKNTLRINTGTLAEL